MDESNNYTDMQSYGCLYNRQNRLTYSKFNLSINDNHRTY